MNRTLLTLKAKRFLATALVLLTLMFVGLPLGPVGSTGSNVVSAQTTTRRYRRRHRSFWKKHRDKLTVAGSALGGAAIGGIAGGKKGAAIGSLVGAGGGAVYTYKIRKRHRRY